MTPYRVPTLSPSLRLLKVYGYGVILVLVGVLLFSIYQPDGVSDGTNHLIAWGAGAIALVSVVAALVAAPELARRKLNSASEWELTDGTLVQRRKGSPTVEIPLTQIESLKMGSGWLMVKGGESSGQVTIPQEVNDFEELKSQLSAYHAITPVKLRFSLLSLFLGVTLIVAYALLLVSHYRRVVLISGVTALILQGYSFLWLLRLSRLRNKALLFSCILSWFLIAWVVYLRVNSAS
jgi:Ca2+/Na+ antiporter